MTDTGGAVVLLLALGPNTRADRERLRHGLSALMAEDPTLRLAAVTLTGDVVIGGMGERHLEIVVDRLKREFGVEARVGRPRVAYRQTVSKEAFGETKFASHHGGRGHYGHVKIHLLPGEPGSGYVFVDETIGGAIPIRFVRAVDAGIKASITRGMLDGYPVDDVRVVLHDGSYHEVDSTELAFMLAGSMAFRQAAAKADPVLLEPVMRVEMVVPADTVDSVVRDIGRRRGSVVTRADRDGMHLIEANVPLSELFGYATDLSSRTRGRGTYVTRLERYSPLRPADGRDDDRDALVGARLKPYPWLRDSGIALPEPDDEPPADCRSPSMASDGWPQFGMRPDIDDQLPGD